MTKRPCRGLDLERKSTGTANMHDSSAYRYEFVYHYIFWFSHLIAIKYLVRSGLRFVCIQIFSNMRRGKVSTQGNALESLSGRGDVVRVRVEPNKSARLVTDWSVGAGVAALHSGQFILSLKLDDDDHYTMTTQPLRSPRVALVFGRGAELLTGTSSNLVSALEDTSMPPIIPNGSREDQGSRPP